jgi:hypothetical protein|tara:strand:- start:1 stop:510 length:510 start_codon:yes stop_codon:yes gene_type:complete
MNKLAEMVFLSEIALQSKIARRAGDRLRATHDHFDELEVWSSIQLILVAAANVSKILWPHREFEARGEILRKLLNVDQDNLLSARKFRNHFEHYDERIENWFKEQPSAVYRDLDIDPFKSIWGITDTNKNRAYDPLKQTITFRGESLDLAAVLDALEEIRLKCSPYILT